MARQGFFDIDTPDRPAVVGLEQVGDDRFRLLRGFTYRGPGGDVHHVFSWNLPCTDLASIPPAFSWFEGRLGRHTLAALLHDHQVAPGPDDPTGRTYSRRRVAADDRFLEALGVSGVPWVRRHLMWSAVHAITRARHVGVSARVAMLVWTVAALVGTTLSVWGLATGHFHAVVLAVVAPLPAAGLWMVSAERPARRWRCGVVAGYGAVLFVPTAALTGLARLVRDAADLVSGGHGPSPWAPRPDCPDPSRRARRGR